MRSYPRLFLTIFLPLIVILNIANREALFRHPIYEEGDDAANALQVYKAKSLSELHGNYSRFNFNHPGPGFFYAYALSEIVLYDELEVVPEPRNAHLWMSLFLQCAFYSAAIALAASRCREPLLASALGLTMGALHFSYAWGAFFSNWPPHVLLMPFLCLLVAGAVVSSGRGEGLFTLVLAGCFLIHGHVAQPLFVFPIVAVAVVALIRQRRAVGESAISWRDASTLAVTAVFVAPLVIDVLSGEQNNARRILLHFTHQSDSGQSFYQSLLCFLSYFVYAGNQDIFNTLRPESYADFYARWPILAVWVGGTFLIFILSWFRRKEDETGRFAWRLFGFYGLGVVLTLVWGMRQDGGLTPFNSFLNFGLIFVPVIIGALLVSTWARGRTVRMVGAVSAVIACIATAHFLRMPIEQGGRGKAVRDNLPALLAADPVKNSVKLLQNGFVDGDWYETTTLARALQRNQIPFFVAPTWRVMFGENKVFENQGHVLENNAVSKWQVVTREDHPDALPLTERHGVRFPVAADLGSLPATISFASTGNHEQFSVFGICARDLQSEWVWSEAKVAVMEFNAQPQSANVLLELDVGAYVSSSRPKGQRIGLIVNGQRLADWTLLTRTKLTAQIPSALWNARSPVRVILELPDAWVPAKLFGSNERRQIAVSFYSLSFKPARESSVASKSLE